MTLERIAVGSTTEGANSAYLVDGRVLVDPGPPVDTAWTHLRDWLEASLEALTDLEYVVCTHWHADHVGLAPRIASAAEATCCLGHADAPLLGAYRDERARRLERDAAALAAWGVPRPVIEELIDRDTPSPLPETTPVRRLHDGDVLAGLQVLETPGHTRGHIALLADEGVLVGDTILPTYTPNIGGSDTRTAKTNPLKTYIETLETLEGVLERSTEGSEPRLYPGHGSRCERTRIHDIRTHHERRTERIRGLLEERDSATPWELATDCFGSLGGIHAKFGAGEVAAHLEYLEGAGAVSEVDGGKYTLSAA